MWKTLLVIAAIVLVWYSGLGPVLGDFVLENPALMAIAGVAMVLGLILSNRGGEE